jgi:hypothetical protein
MSPKRLPILLVAKALYLVSPNSLFGDTRCPEYPPGIHVIKNKNGDDIYSVGSAISSGSDAESFDLADREAKGVAKKLLATYISPRSKTPTLSGAIHLGTCRSDGESFATFKYSLLTSRQAVHMRDMIKESFLEHETPMR